MPTVIRHTIRIISRGLPHGKQSLEQQSKQAGKSVANAESVQFIVESGDVLDRNGFKGRTDIRIIAFCQKKFPEITIFR